MKTIKVKHWADIPIDFTGIVEFENEPEIWLKNGKWHREDGAAAAIWNDGYKEWWLNESFVFHSASGIIDFTNIIILSKHQHPEYSTVQVWKYIDQYGIKEQIVIPGMEAWITE